MLLVVQAMGYVEENVFAKVLLVKLPQKFQPPFSPDEMRALLDSQDHDTLTGCRNFALILFLLDTGARASECIGVDLSDVDWERRRILIRHSKGGKERWVGLGEQAATALRDYVRRFRAGGEGALFLTSAGQRMASAGTLEVLLRRLGARVGVKKVHPHRFRHTFATWAIESGAREIDVQMLLGHADLTMTQRYARAYTSEQAVRAHAELSLVARLNAASQ